MPHDELSPRIASLYAMAASCGVILLLLMGSAARGGGADPLAVVLSVPHTEYLLGEPVPLDVVVRNVSGRKLQARRIPPVYVQILVGREGHDAARIEQEYLIHRVALRRTTLEPNGSWTNQLRALYHFRPGSRGRGRFAPDLAFPEPGTYTIQVRLPLIGVVVEGSPAGVESHYIESNPLRVQIRAPQGDDAHIYQAIREGEILHLLRTGRLWDGRDRPTVLKVAALLREHPRTGYRDCLSWALRTYYRSTQNRLKPDDRERVRQLLGEPAEGPLPDGPRA